MKRYLLGLLVALGIGAASPLAAAPIVMVGSTYEIVLDGTISGNFFRYTATFDGVAEGATRGGLDLRIEESEQVLSDGRSRIRIKILANGDLFPALGETAGFGIGAFDDPFDLALAPVLSEASASFHNGSSLVHANFNLAASVPNADPWDGYFPAAGVVFGIGSLGGLGIDSITLDLLAAARPIEVSEPAELALFGLGMMALMTAWLRRQNKDG